MIRTRVFGGLGNQLFQYACGRALSLERSAPLVLDVGWFLYGNRPLRLGDFSVQGRFDPGLKGGLPEQPSLAARSLRKARSVGTGRRVLKDPENGFDDRVPAAPDGTILDGYWQSYRYFERHRDALLKDLVCLRELPEGFFERAADVRQTPTVAVHYRRGDYVDGSGQAVYQALDADYYRQAAREIARKVAQPTFLVFSDDPQRAREDLDLPGRTEFAQPFATDADLWDFLLMARCGHHIIANSTFSWWAAWLADDPDQIVVAPSKWFADRPTPVDDLLPQTWIHW